jgi:hypothetical protein
MSPPDVQTAAEVGQDLGSGKMETIRCTDEFSIRRQKRKIGNFWSEGGGRHRYSYGPHGITVFDTWVWTGEPLPRRRA